MRETMGEDAAPEVLCGAVSFSSNGVSFSGMGDMGIDVSDMIQMITKETIGTKEETEGESKAEVAVCRTLVKLR